MKSRQIQKNAERLQLCSRLRQHRVKGGNQDRESCGYLRTGCREYESALEQVRPIAEFQKCDPTNVRGREKVSAAHKFPFLVVIPFDWNNKKK